MSSDKNNFNNNYNYIKLEIDQNQKGHYSKIIPSFSEIYTQSTQNQAFEKYQQQYHQIDNLQDYSDQINQNSIEKHQDINFSFNNAYRQSQNNNISFETTQYKKPNDSLGLELENLKNQLQSYQLQYIQQNLKENSNLGKKILFNQNKQFLQVSAQDNLNMQINPDMHQLDFKFLQEENKIESKTFQCENEEVEEEYEDIFEQYEKKYLQNQNYPCENPSFSTTSFNQNNQNLSQNLNSENPTLTYLEDNQFNFTQFNSNKSQNSNTKTSKNNGDNKDIQNRNKNEVYSTLKFQEKLQNELDKNLGSRPEFNQSPNNKQKIKFNLDNQIRNIQNLKFQKMRVKKPIIDRKIQTSHTATNFIVILVNYLLSIWEKNLKCKKDPLQSITYHKKQQKTIKNFKINNKKKNRSQIAQEALRVCSCKNCDEYKFLISFKQQQRNKNIDDIKAIMMKSQRIFLLTENFILQNSAYILLKKSEKLQSQTKKKKNSNNNGIHMVYAYQTLPAFFWGLYNTDQFTTIKN